MVTTKADLVREVAARTQLDGETALQVVEAVIKAMQDSFERGDGIEIRKFGVFRVYKTSEKVGRNPRTGEEAFVPSFHRVRFKISKSVPVGAPSHNGRMRRKKGDV
jgi:nucleoid DNA-binding protein